jgi:hypothetical protein
MGPGLPRSGRGDHRQPPTVAWRSATRRHRATPAHHRHPAALDCYRPRSTAAMDGRPPTRSSWRGEWNAAAVDVAQASPDDLCPAAATEGGMEGGAAAEVGGGPVTLGGERASCFRVGWGCSVEPVRVYSITVPRSSFLVFSFFLGCVHFLCF